MLVGKKKSRQKILVGKNLSHFPKIWSLFTDLFFTAKVWFFWNKQCILQPINENHEIQYIIFYNLFNLRSANTNIILCQYYPFHIVRLCHMWANSILKFDTRAYFRGRLIKERGLNWRFNLGGPHFHHWIIVLDAIPAWFCVQLHWV